MSMKYFIFACMLVNNTVITEDLLAPPKFSIFIAGIFGGRKVVPHSHPYQVWIQSIAYGDTSFEECGGVLISKNYVLAAAHCVDRSEYILLTFGANDAKADEETQILKWAYNDYTGTKVRVHPNWHRSFDYNLAIIRLLKEIEFNTFIKPIRLPKYDDTTLDLTGRTAKLVGWSLLESVNGTRTIVLQESNLKILSDHTCKEYFEIWNVKVSLCTKPAYSSPCNGYFGGALIIDNTLFGLTSCGDINLDIGMPSTFTRITDYLGFIDIFTDVDIELHDEL